MDTPLRAGVDTVASLLRSRPRLVHDADASSDGLALDNRDGGKGDGSAGAVSAALPKSA
jgi:hypothetical protein